MLIRVESYSGYKSDERPVRFQLGGRWLAVEEILDRWYDPNASYFKVRADDGDFYILRRHEPDGPWTLESYRRGPTITLPTNGPPLARRPSHN